MEKQAEEILSGIVAAADKLMLFHLEQQYEVLHLAALSRPFPQPQWLAWR